MSKLFTWLKQALAIIPKEPGYIAVVPKTYWGSLARLLGLVALESFVFPHLPGILFDATLGNIFVLTIVITIVRYVLLFLTLCGFVPLLLILVLLLAKNYGWDGNVEKLRAKLGESNQRKIIEQGSNVFANFIYPFIYPALAIILVGKINPNLLSVSCWYGLLFAAGSVWMLDTIVSIYYRALARCKE